MISGDRMMITLRKVPLAIAIAAGILSAQAGPSTLKVMLVPALAGPGVAVNNNVSRQPVLKVNTVLVTNVKPMRN
jgi:hypothetical protein